MGNKEVIEAILYYQQCLDKYTRRNDEAKVLYCLTKLYKMPINIEHLEKTGVGRTVNALRKLNGEVAEAAKTLVGKWKEMVAAMGEESEAKDVSKSEPVKKHESESKDKHRVHKEKLSSSHRNSDKKKSRSSSNSEEESKSSSSSQKRLKEEIRHRHHESSSSKKKKESKHSKHKSSKQKYDSSSESDVDESDSDSSSVKHRNAKSKRHESSSDERESLKRHKHKSSSRKRGSSDLDEDSDREEEIKDKRKKYSQSENSDEEVEIVDVKKHSHRSKHKEEKKEKLRHEHHKKEKKEAPQESKKDSKSYEKDSKSKSKTKSDKKVKDDVDKNSKSLSKHHSDHKKPKKSSSQKSGVKISENGIGSGSGASFAEALGMLMPSGSKTTPKKKVAIIHPLPVETPLPLSGDSSPDILTLKVPDLLSPKKLAPLDINVDNLLPEITPHYRPVGGPVNSGTKNKLLTDDETLSALIYSKISRTKVYSGNKVAWGAVPSLFDICTRVLQDNIDALEYTGGVPYIILKPVIERANPDQLFMLEHHNPYLIEDTDELWQLHCNKEFRSKRREEMETWRDMYMRCLDEREAKLKALTANIKQSQDKSLPVRQTKLAYVDSFVKPPRNIARKQAKHGTGGVEKKPAVTPSARLSQLATSGAAGQIAVPNPGPRAASSTGHFNSTAVMKPKKAPLMQKTLALMKSRIFRR